MCAIDLLLKTVRVGRCEIQASPQLSWSRTECDDWAAHFPSRNECAWYCMRCEIVNPNKSRGRNPGFWQLIGSLCSKAFCDVEVDRSSKTAGTRFFVVSCRDRADLHGMLISVMIGFCPDPGPRGCSKNIPTTTELRKMNGACQKLLLLDTRTCQHQSMHRDRPLLTLLGGQWQLSKIMSHPLLTPE